MATQAGQSGGNRSQSEVARMITVLNDQIYTDPTSDISDDPNSEIMVQPLGAWKTLKLYNRACCRYKLHMLDRHHYATKSVRQGHLSAPEPEKDEVHSLSGTKSMKTIEYPKTIGQAVLEALEALPHDLVLDNVALALALIWCRLMDEVDFYPELLVKRFILPQTFPGSPEPMPAGRGHRARNVPAVWDVLLLDDIHTIGLPSYRNNARLGEKWVGPLFCHHLFHEHWIPERNMNSSVFSSMTAPFYRVDVLHSYQPPESSNLNSLFWCAPANVVQSRYSTIAFVDNAVPEPPQVDGLAFQNNIVFNPAGYFPSIPWGLWKNEFLERVASAANGGKSLAEIGFNQNSMLPEWDGMDQKFVRGGPTISPLDNNQVSSNASVTNLGSEDEEPDEQEEPAEPDEPDEQEESVIPGEPVEQEEPVEPEEPVEQEEPRRSVEFVDRQYVDELFRIAQVHFMIPPLHFSDSMKPIISLVAKHYEAPDNITRDEFDMEFGYAVETFKELYDAVEYIVDDIPLAEEDFETRVVDSVAALLGLEPNAGINGIKEVNADLAAKLDAIRWQATHDIDGVSFADDSYFKERLDEVLGHPTMEVYDSLFALQQAYESLKDVVPSSEV
ncbi:hypothetical protein CDEST_11142 [Colletotrichum destructivum]|uniref:Uncharacterized protein n=1 Tax=Colletotrichum destructivum TaxID=34406 RepID=A0AAX4ISE2_9PEZI|nr:hypothetical protein CDEST_11142 [Colletotrichum destructivum]